MTQTIPGVATAVGSPVTGAGVCEAGPDLVQAVTGASDATPSLTVCNAAAATAETGATAGATGAQTPTAIAGAPHQPNSTGLLQRMNEVCVRVAKTTIPPEERTTVARRMRPSVQFRQFTEARAVEMAAVVTLQRKKELYQQM